MENKKGKFVIDNGSGKITNLPSQLLMLGHHRNADETPRRFAGGPMMGSGIWIISPLKNTRKTQKKTTTKTCQCLTVSAKPMRTYHTCCHENLFSDCEHVHADRCLFYG